MTLADPSTATAATAPPRKAARAHGFSDTRDPRLDFFRGVAMFIILIAHTPGNWLTLWIPARWGFSDATEIFVFCSGMASAIAFGKAFRDKGWPMGTARVSFRVWQVYWAHIGLFIAIAAAMAALNATGWFDRDYVGQLNLYPFFNDPQTNLPALLTLTYVPNYFDILPMYLVILAMMPLMVGAARLSPWLTGVLVALIWLCANAAEFGLGGLLPDLSLPAEPWSQRRWFFNPFGWQLVFFTGFALMIGWLPKPPVHPVLIAAALVVVLVNVPLSNIGVREFGLDWARDWRGAHSDLFAKSDFGPLRYLHFLSLAYLAWVAVGPRGDRIRPRGTGWIALAWSPVLAIIMKVGQQSLAVFVFSMFIARFLGVAFDTLGRTHLTMLAVNLAGFAAITACAYIAGWFKSHPWRAKKG